jgi:hypothetical protein
MKRNLWWDRKSADQKFSAFSGTRTFFIVVTNTCHWLFPHPVESNPYHHFVFLWDLINRLPVSLIGEFDRKHDDYDYGDDHSCHSCIWACFVHQDWNSFFSLFGVRPSHHLPFLLHKLSSFAFGFRTFFPSISLIVFCYVTVICYKHCQLVSK